MMEAAWGRPPSEVVVAVSPKPIAAASLGQVTACTAPCLPCILRHIGTGYDVHLVAVSRGS